MIGIQGFKAVPVKLCDTSTAIHWLFWKEHNSRVKCSVKPEGRTLFVINVPSYWTEDCFKNMFKPIATVTSALFHKKPETGPPAEQEQFFPTSPQIKGFRVAYIVFETPADLNSVLEWNITEPLTLTSHKFSLSSGLQKWCREYNEQIPSIEDLQKNVDSFMEKYDADVNSDKQKMKEAMEEDDEGWITVTKKGKKPGFARKESIHNRIMAKEELKRSKKELLNFYTFQIKESKMKHLANLRQKFEDVKKRINVMKQSRKFRPF